MARPRLGEKKKTNRLTVFFSDDEYADILLKAEVSALEPAEYLRQAGLDKRIVAPPPAANREALLELNSIGRNLNQLLILLRIGDVKEWLQLEATVERTAELLKRAAKDLITRG